MTGLVLDTSALIGLQRDLRRLRVLIRIASEDERSLRTTAPAITEFLGGTRGGARPAAQYVASKLGISPVDDTLARRAAALMQGALDAGGRARPSAIDALVAAEAERTRDAVVFDGDRADFEALADASGDLDLKPLAALAE